MEVEPPVTRHKATSFPHSTAWVLAVVPQGAEGVKEGLEGQEDGQATFHPQQAQLHPLLGSLIIGNPWASIIKVLLESTKAQKHIKLEVSNLKSKCGQK